MKVLAIDPGYGRCGMALVEKMAPARERVLFSTCVETSPKMPFGDRLRTVVAECERLLREFSPDALALEKLYFTKSRTTAMQVAEVRGALLKAAADARIDVFEYTPGEVKSASAGFGAADKKQIARMLHALVDIPRTPRLDDEYDAIAIGITHLARHRD